MHKSRDAQIVGPLFPYFAIYERIVSDQASLERWLPRRHGGPCAGQVFWTSIAVLFSGRQDSRRGSAPPTSGGVTPAIALTNDALKHLNKMRSERNEDLCLIIGVKQGGCSGMSYTMEFENRGNQRPDDSIIEYNSFVIGNPLSS
ncbi:hypothetical protein LOK49_LG11G01983 [Camellia lanceoleosa]|uniref:Uncharacterized protein n=1 Tax=Camellia lanceoleosa TaxID=1840588 RepID=A0ACC0FYQ3_9ERIC|nr:hypothetical protein LOK49_LG11G01983 [Camellia lanceoleosa]